MANKLFIFDVDGCLTPGAKDFDNESKVKTKRFTDSDRTFMKLMKARGDKIVFLSGDRNINQAYAKYCDVDFYCSKMNDGKLDKTVYYEIFQMAYDVKPEDMIFVGDCMIFDYPLMKLIIEGGGRAFCPNDSNIPWDIAANTPHPQVLALTPVKRLHANGGEGILDEVYNNFYFRNYDIGDFAT